MLRTPLYKYHLDQGAKMVDFAGWEMPIMYKWREDIGGGGGIIAEHHQVRKAGGFFDVSHMGRVRFKGRHARRLVERLVTRRVSDMTPLGGDDSGQGQARYALVLNDRGGIKDDVLVYRVDEDEFLMVVNAANREKLLPHFEEARGDLVCEIEDRTEKTAMIAVQGPKVMEVVSSFSKEIPTLKRYRFVRKNYLIMKLLVSRTGYTGEDGIEVILPANVVEMAMKMLLKGVSSGQEALVKPAGLGCRDTLRLEAGMALYGYELSEDTNALATGLGFAMNLDKQDDERGEKCIGLDALLKTQAEGGPRESLVGLFIEGKRTARPGMTVRAGGADVGGVTSACMSPTLGRAIAMAYVNKEHAEVGTELKIDRGSGDPLAARVTALPFYKATKKKPAATA